jgi:hypothetical protein
LLTSSRLKYLYLSYLSKPASDRVIYRAIGKRKARKILEIGIGTAGRALRMIDLATRMGPEIRYVAIDMFEARGSENLPGLPLKEAHRLLKTTSAQVQLIPGEPASALARWANSLSNVDVVIISADYDEQALCGAWFYLPRMLHANSAVYRESHLTGGADKVLTLVAPDEIAKRAATGRNRRAA